MSNVIEFRLKRRATREQAKQWLIANFERFPNEGSVGRCLFHGWRFIRALDGDVYFANCIESGISESELASINPPQTDRY